MSRLHDVLSRLRPGGSVTATVPGRAGRPLPRSVLVGVGGVVWLGWVATSVLPEFTGSRADPTRVDHQVRDRLVVENGYTAGWLSWYHEQHGALPEVLPPNRAAAGNRQVVEVCPTTRQDLISARADWAFCPTDGRVRALYRNPGYLLGTDAPPNPTLFPRVAPSSRKGSSTGSFDGAPEGGAPHLRPPAVTAP